MLYRLWAAVVFVWGCAAPDGRTGGGGAGGTGGSAGSGGTGGGASPGGDAGAGRSDGSGGPMDAGSGGGGSSGGAGGSGGSAGSGGGGGGPITDGGNGDFSVSFPDGGATCGQMTTPVPFSPKTPDVIIAFDVSGSMGQPFGSGGSRYTTERDLLTPLVTMFQDKIRWGYEEFPMKNCGQPCPDKLCMPFKSCADKVLVEPAFKNAAMVNRYIEGKVLCGSGGPNTPTRGALRQIRDFYASFKDGVTERFVLLSTDGEPNICGNPDCGLVIEEVKGLLAAGVKTLVLGVSEEVQASSCLNQAAQAGGAPRPGGPPYFYPGNSPAALEMYLRQIITGIAKPSCSIDLTSTPPDPTRVAVFFDTAQIPWDPTHTNGWDYAPGTKDKILIYGSHCAKLEGFMVSDIHVEYGCPPCGGTVSCN